MGLGRLADRSFEAVIFDMDGTLIDSTPAVVRSWTTWAIEHERHPGRAAAAPRHPVGRRGRGVLLARGPARPAPSSGSTSSSWPTSTTSWCCPAPPRRWPRCATAKNAIATSCTVPLAKARIDAAELVPPSVLVTADDVEPRQAGPRPVPRGGRAAGRRPEPLPGGRGRADGTDLGPRGRLLHPRGGHHHARGRAGGRRDRAGPVRTSRFSGRATDG